MGSRISLLCAVAVALAASRLPAQSITAVDVKRACDNHAATGAKDRRLKDVCALAVPVNASQWNSTVVKTWRDALTRDSLAEAIRLYADPSATLQAMLNPPAALSDSVRRMRDSGKEPGAAAEALREWFLDVPAARAAAFARWVFARANEAGEAQSLGLELRDALAAAGNSADSAAVMKKVLSRGDVGTLLARVDLWSRFSAQEVTATDYTKAEAQVLKIGAVAQSTAPPSLSFEHNQSSLLWGTADFVMSRAGEQLQTFAAQGLIRRLCGDSRDRLVLQSSCRLMQPGSENLGRYGLGLVQNAVARDLQSLPYTLLQWAHADPRLQQAYEGLPAQENTRRADSIRALRARADEIQAAISVLRYVVQTARGDDPWTGFSRLADSMNTAWVAAPAGRREFTTSNALLTVAAIFGTRVAPSGSGQISWTDTVPHPLLRAQLIAWAANARLSPAVGDSIPWRVFALTQSLEQGIGDLIPLRSALIQAQRGRADTTITVRGARHAFADGLFNLADTLIYGIAQIQPAMRGAEIMALSSQVRAIVLPAIENDFQSSLVALNEFVVQHLGPLLSNPEFVERWTGHMAFVTDVASASNAEGVSNALNSFVRRDGYVTKRRGGGRVRVTLNAFAGLYGAPNVAPIAGETTAGERAAFAGPYLPIGVELTFPGLGIRKLGRLGLYGQVLDLGAMASWRLQGSDSIADAPHVGVGQVFSPGVFAVWDVAGAPVTVGYGWSLAPQLRAVERERDDVSAQQEDADPRRRNASRWGLFIALDVPLFP